MQTYQGLTSKGPFLITVDGEKIVFVKGREYIDKLYLHCDSRNDEEDEAFIVKEIDGKHWLFVELEDNYYGSPEYLLTPVETTVVEVTHSE